jgi:hypothetical protein
MLLCHLPQRVCFNALVTVTTAVISRNFTHTSHILSTLSVTNIASSAHKQRQVVIAINESVTQREKYDRPLK